MASVLLKSSVFAASRSRCWFLAQSGSFNQARLPTRTWSCIPGLSQLDRLCSRALLSNVSTCDLDATVPELQRMQMLLCNLRQHVGPTCANFTLSSSSLCFLKRMCSGKLSQAAGGCRQRQSDALAANDQAAAERV